MAYGAKSTRCLTGRATIWCERVESSSAPARQCAVTAEKHPGVKGAKTKHISGTSEGSSRLRSAIRQTLGPRWWRRGGEPIPPRWHPTLRRRKNTRPRKPTHTTRRMLRLVRPDGRDSASLLSPLDFLTSGHGAIGGGDGPLRSQEWVPSWLRAPERRPGISALGATGEGGIPICGRDDGRAQRFGILLTASLTAHHP